MHLVSRSKDCVFVSAPSKSPQTLLSSLRSDAKAFVDVSYLPLIGAIVEMHLVPNPSRLSPEPVVLILIHSNYDFFLKFQIFSL